MDVILLAWCHGRPKYQEGVMKKLYRVTLAESERGDLQKLVSVGKAAAARNSFQETPDSFVGRRIGRRFVEVRPGDCRIVGLRSSQR